MATARGPHCLESKCFTSLLLPSSSVSCLLVRKIVCLLVCLSVSLLALLACLFGWMAGWLCLVWFLFTFVVLAVGGDGGGGGGGGVNWGEGKPPCITKTRVLFLNRF